MSKDKFEWTDALVMEIIDGAVGNMKDYVMNNNGFISAIKAAIEQVLNDENVMTFVNGYTEKDLEDAFNAGRTYSGSFRNMQLDYPKFQDYLNQLKSK